MSFSLTINLTPIPPKKTLFITSHNSLCVSIWNHTLAIPDWRSLLCPKSFCIIFVSFGYTGERLNPRLRRKDWILWASLLEEKVFGLRKYVLEVKSIQWDRNWCWFLTKPKTLLKIVWKAGAPCLLFKTAGLHLRFWTNWLCEKSFHVTIYRRKREFFQVIWRCFAHVKLASEQALWGALEFEFHL